MDPESQVDGKTRACRRCKAERPVSEFLPKKYVGSTYCSTCREEVEAIQKGRRQVRELRRFREVQREVVEAYGGGCRCCGETRVEFLRIDYVFGEKDSMYRGDGLTWGSRAWEALKRLRFPQDRYRILCFNCSEALSAVGYCPHGESQESPLRHYKTAPRRVDASLASRRRGRKFARSS